MVTTGGTVVADADAQGATISVLPALGTTGLLSITVGAAHTTSTFNRTTGASVATFSPAILTIKLLGSVIPIGLGSPITLFAGTPLESTISLGAGSTIKNADGSVGSVADGVGIDLLKGINHGISLHLAHAQSGVGGAIATTSPTTAAPTTVTTAAVTNGTLTAHLATTGTDEPLLPVGLALVLAGYLTRRTLLARRAARTPR